MPDASDRDLALRARRGDAEAFGELVRRYQVSVFNVCYRLLGERREAEDMAQEAFIRAYERLDTFNVDLPFGPWMRRVAANVCLNRLERARRAPVSVPLDDERDPEAGGGDPAAAREHTERAEAVRAAILSLPPHHRAVIELRHFQELSYDEIAATLRIPLSDVKSHLFRARKALAGMLRPDTGEHG
jgi:RNA polymerase sigma-70 factor (ECF subfamily)